MAEVKLPLVSVITPVYNGEKYIEELIQSVLGQDYPLIEHIIIDDGSTDGTVEILKKYLHLRWWTRENKGQYETMNEGLLAAKGGIVSFISADDLYVTPNALSSVMDFWCIHPDAKVVYGMRSDIDEYGKPLSVQPLIRPDHLWLYGYTCMMSHSSMFVNRDFLLENKLFFDRALRYNGDLDWILRLIDFNKNSAMQLMRFINCNLSIIRYHSQQTTKQYVNLITEERQKVLTRHGVNLVLHKITRLALRWVSLSQKATYTLRTKGLRGLWGTWAEWKSRQN